jgi:hypothetical protein
MRSAERGHDRPLLWRSDFGRAASADILPSIACLPLRRKRHRAGFGGRPAPPLQMAKLRPRDGGEVSALASPHSPAAFRVPSAGDAPLARSDVRFVAFE